MSRLSVYEYKDYKKFVLDWMKKAPNEGRGQRKNLAEAIQCQTPYITHVLGGDYHFSGEQAEATARWLGLNEAEAEYFVLLVLRQRAGTRTLENHFARQLSERRERATQLKKRLKISETLSPEIQMKYYSSWHFAAIHLALLIPELQTVSALLEHFKFPRVRLMEVIDFLISSGLIEETRSGLKVTRVSLHLGKNSPLLAQHHSQWRLRAIEAFQTTSSQDLHYSAVTSISAEDFEIVRERLSLLLEEFVERVKGSKDEQLATLNMDWFTI